MIPADVASRLRLITPDQTAQPQPVAPTRQLTDVLSDPVPGQRILAEIQALLPNGAYRAMVAQREIVLALPFSAKAGDALELEVVESDGKLTLAFLANRTAGEQGKAQEAVSATLSRTGKMIGDLLGSIDDEGKKGSQTTPLNGNRPLLDGFPKDASQLVPVLKEALTRSGMFYEAHQVRWAEGKLPTEALLQEPQGKLSNALQANHATGHVPPDGTNSPRESRPAVESSTGLAGATSDPLGKTFSQGAIPPEIAPIVRQQLDALATQNYAWQGQVWPGQQMQWEIEEDSPDNRGAEENPARQWQTRLRLTLPILGGIEAVMRLRGGGAVEISLVTDSDDSRRKLAAAGEGLRRQLEDAGINLTGLAVQNGEASG